IELTHDLNSLLPLFVAVMIAYAFTVLIMKRSILTEKISRRGFHLSREYAIDPLEILFVRQVMRTNVVKFPHEATIEQLFQTSLNADTAQRLFPLVNRHGGLTGVLTRKDLQSIEDRAAATVADVEKKNVVVAFPDEPLRVVVDRMAETGFTRL